MPEERESRLADLRIAEVGHTADKEDDPWFSRLALDNLGMSLKEWFFCQGRDMAFSAYERKRKAQAKPRGLRDFAKKERAEDPAGCSPELHQAPVLDNLADRGMESREPALFGKSLAGDHDDLIGRDDVGTLVDAVAAQKTLRQRRIGRVIELDVPLQQMLAKGNLAPCSSRLFAENRECGTVSPAGAALDTLLEFLFNTLERFSIFHFVFQDLPSSGPSIFSKVKATKG